MTLITHELIARRARLSAASATTMVALLTAALLVVLAGSSQATASRCWRAPR
jgi:hypothetical protein